MGTYDTVIFDLDGTLLNTLEDLADAVNYVMRQHGYPERTLEEVRLFVGNGIRKLMERAVPDSVQGTAFETVFEEFREYYTDHCQIKTGVYDGIMELLDILDRKGCAMAVVSNKNHAAVCELNHIYFEKYMKTAIGQREGVRKKPAPDTVYEALKALGSVKEKALYVGDSDVDFATAENAGMDCVLVSWGFRTREELKDCRPKAVIEKPMELLDIFS